MTPVRTRTRSPIITSYKLCVKGRAPFAAVFIRLTHESLSAQALHCRMVLLTRTWSSVWRILFCLALTDGGSTRSFFRLSPASVFRAVLPTLRTFVDTQRDCTVLDLVICKELFRNHRSGHGGSKGDLSRAIIVQQSGYEGDPADRKDTPPHPKENHTLGSSVERAS